jgi:lysozyme
MEVMTVTNILEQLKRDEGLKLKPYKDTVGKTTIGIGRNLDDVGISEDEAIILLHNDLAKAAGQIRAALPWADQLGPIRGSVLGNMAFNMGIAGLLNFHKFLTALRLGNYDQAATEMLDSKWASQVGARAQRLAQQIRTNEWV